MKLAHFFTNVDLRQSHPGLLQLLKSENIEIEKLKDGECIIFFNVAMTKLKMFCGGSKVLIYYSNGSRRIEPEAVKHIPMSLGGGEIHYKRALAKGLEEIFRRRNRKNG